MSEQAPRSPYRRITAWAVNLGLVAVTLLCLGWLAPSLFGMERYVITGGSMSGTFEKGSLAVERQVPTAQLEVGDVITYQPPAGAGTTDLVTHRIVRIALDERGRQVLRTKGDANDTVDPWRFRLTKPMQPVVQFTVPYAGHLLITLADRETRMIVIGGPAVLVALLALGELLVALTRRAAEGATATADTATPVPVPSQRMTGAPAASLAHGRRLPLGTGGA